MALSDPLQFFELLNDEWILDFARARQRRHPAPAA
jgi:hypothetical protein